MSLAVIGSGPLGRRTSTSPTGPFLALATPDSLISISPGHLARAARAASRSGPCCSIPAERNSLATWSRANSPSASRKRSARTSPIGSIPAGSAVAMCECALFRCVVFAGVFAGLARFRRQTARPLHQGGASGSRSLLVNRSTSTDRCDQVLQVRMCAR